MNFYEAQDDARKRTKWLVLYFILAVIGVIVALYSVFGIYLMNTSARYFDETTKTYQTIGGEWWNLEAFITIAVGTTAVILLGNIFKSLQLAGGGEVVARDMGGRLVDPHTSDFHEKRLINVVEEMAISSGVPVPQVWMMDQEAGINAFAAGTEPGNAVIGVTRGCVQQLNRSELQGVIAHEFSHILNGDMKMNMRLIGWLFGIMMLSLLGQMLFHSLRFVRIRSNSRDNNGAGIVIAMLAAGVALMVIGSIGVFFARMIQAAISRQREYLADASAVEFTRDPAGIAGALKKIGGQQEGAAMTSAKAGEASHMFFSDGGMFSFGFATHPPLDVRISAIEKSWDGKFKKTELPPVADRSVMNRGDARVSGFSAGGSTSDIANDETSVNVPREDWNHLGDASLNDIAVGGKILAGLSEEWISACHDREYAQALVFGMLLAEDKALKKGEVSFLRKTAGDSAVELALQWQDELAEIHSSKKIALLDLCIPTLRRLTMPEYERFIEITRWLIASDGEVDIFEYMLQKVLERHLSSHFLRHGSVRVKYNKLSKVSHEANILLSTLAGIGASNESDLKTAYQQATQEIQYELGGDLQILPPEECGLGQVNEALEKLEQTSSLVRKQLIHACGLAVMHDGVLESREAEMLRAVADAMGCAIPPFVKAS